MDLTAYFAEKREIAAHLVDVYGKNGVVHITSLRHRESGTTAGTTLSATIDNAARVIANGTHREATRAEITAFMQHQERNRVTSMTMEQARKREFVVMVDSQAPSMAGLQSRIREAHAPTTDDLLEARMEGIIASDDDELTAPSDE